MLPKFFFKYDDIDAEKILMKLLADPNEVVRVCACELGMFTQSTIR